MADAQRINAAVGRMLKEPAVLERLEHITGQKVVCERGDVLETAWV